MSTRYVWAKYDADALSSGSITYDYPYPLLQVGTDYTISQDGVINVSGSVSTLQLGRKISTEQYRYLKEPETVRVEYADIVGKGDVWNFSSNGKLTILKTDGSTQGWTSLGTKKYGSIKGPFVGNVSSSYPNFYPKNSKNGIYTDRLGVSYWYDYLGSDNIDPSTVTVPYYDLEVGDSVSIFVSTYTPTYGGTIFYQYQYSINGGNWVNIGGRTTATSAAVTIPEGATQFQARVLASDGWGFTSSTYVYGPAKEVSQLKAYVGVNAKAGALKKGYVGVGGKAMQLAKGYVGVGGVAKKLF